MENKAENENKIEDNGSCVEGRKLGMVVSFLFLGILIFENSLLFGLGLVFLKNEKYYDDFSSISTISITISLVGMIIFVLTSLLLTCVSANNYGNTVKWLLIFDLILFQLIFMMYGFGSLLMLLLPMDIIPSNPSIVSNIISFVELPLLNLIKVDDLENNFLHFLMTLYMVIGWLCSFIVMICLWNTIGGRVLRKVFFFFFIYLFIFRWNFL
jgi:hypothetical protein